MNDLVPRAPYPADPAPGPNAGFGFTSIPPAGHGPAPHPEGLELRRVLSALRRRFWLVLLGLGLGGGAGYFLHQRLAPVYRAHAVIRIQDPTLQMAGRPGLADYGYGWTDPIQSQLAVLKSQSVLAEIVDREGLRLVSTDPAFPVAWLADVRLAEQADADSLVLRFGADSVDVAAPRTGLRARAAYGERLDAGSVSFVVMGRPEDAPAELVLLLHDRYTAANRLGNNLTLTTRPLTNIVDVEFTAGDPAVAQRVANRAVTVFRDRSAADARGAMTRRRRFLEEQLGQADTLLRSTQAALSGFRSQAQVFSSQARAVAQQSGLMGLEMRQEELRADQQMYGALLEELGRARSPGETSDRLQALVAAPELAQNPVIASLFAQLLTLEADRQRLTSGPWGATAANPDVARLDQQITSTKERLVAAVRSHMDALDARSAALADLRSRTARQVAALPAAEAEEARLIQEVEAVQRTVEQLREELYRTQISEAVEAGPVDVVDLASLPGPAQRVGLRVMLGLGLLLGFLAGSGGALLVDLLNTRFHGRDEVERALRVQVVGVIPKLPGGSRRWKPKGGAPLNPTPVSGANGQVPGLVTVLEARSFQAEAFRTLRTNLLHSPDGNSIRTLVVTSPLPGEGKTTTAANLAVTYAQQGLKVLLVDCDLRKPAIDRLFHLKRSPGLTELMLGGIAWSQVQQPFAAVEGLMLVTSGDIPPNPTELLGGARMRAVVAALRERFEIIILDTPPLSGGADAAILGASCDGVLLVVRTGATHRESARLAVRQLATVGARLLGVVMNDPRGEVGREGGYYQYEYYGEKK